MRSVYVLCIFVLAACEQRLPEQQGRARAEQDGTPEGPAAVIPPIEVPSTAAFEPNKDAMLLLPFRVRLNKLAAVAGVGTDDPMFAELKKNRLDLGDYDYGANVAPDLRWTGKRIALWIASLRPVCTSSAMTSRYPTFNDDELSAFILRAHGRPATADDRAELAAAMTETPLPSSVQSLNSCLALLSTTELVGQ